MSLKRLLILDENDYQMIYGLEELRAVARLVETVAPAQTKDSITIRPRLLRNIEVLFSGWGCPLHRRAILSRGAESPGDLLRGRFGRDGDTPTVWDRGIAVSSAIGANAVPVAEYALSAISFSLKRKGGAHA